MARVLVAEDEPLLRMMICEDLAENGHRVTEARDGDEAAEILRTNSDFDLLVTDIRMPGSVDGWALGELAEALAPDIRIIYATGFSNSMPGLGPHERMLRKPFIYGDVASLIGELGL